MYSTFDERMENQNTPLEVLRSNGECYLIWSDSSINWSIWIYPLLDTEWLYFDLLDSVDICNAKRHARMSLVYPRYVEFIDTTREQWILNDEEKLILCNIINSPCKYDISGTIISGTIWTYMRDMHIDMDYSDLHNLRWLIQIPTPDYSKLSKLILDDEGDEISYTNMICNNISQELTEAYGVDALIWVARDVNWSIWLHPATKSDMVYFQLFDSKDMFVSKKCARISVKSPEYITCSDDFRERWILDDHEKATLCNILNKEYIVWAGPNRYDHSGRTIWETLLETYVEQVMYTGYIGDLSYVPSLPLPDYTKLPNT
jgi:hypothetical protein